LAGFTVFATPLTFGLEAALGFATDRASVAGFETALDLSAEGVTLTGFASFLTFLVVGETGVNGVAIGAAGNGVALTTFAAGASGLVVVMGMSFLLNGLYSLHSLARNAKFLVFWQPNGLSFEAGYVM
jgi:hypothetical protein